MTTKTAQFTPGPWIVETTNTLPGECADNVHRLCYPGYRIHGICAIWNNTRTSKANATLIAAAPAMYAELVNGLGLLEASYHDMCDKYGKDSMQAEVVWDQVERTRNVIAQAEGSNHA